MNAPAGLRSSNRLIDALKAGQQPAAAGEAVSVHFLRTATIEAIEPFLTRFCRERGLDPRISFGGYGGAQIDMGSADAKTDIAVCCFTLDQFARDWELAPWAPSAIAAELERLLDKLVAHFRGIVVVNTFLPPSFDAGGARDNHLPHSRKRRVEAVNAALRDMVNARAGRCLLVDFADVLARVGAANAFDSRLGYLMRAPFSPTFLEEYARAIARVACALKGKAKKCLALDCDNTLWGGIIGEDGLEGIALSPSEFPGAAYYDFQKTVLRLHAEGVLIALCSRNNEADVFEVLDKHPHCLIKREHLAAHRINWDDKVANLSALAAEMNIGLDHVVLVDDSPFELGHIQAALPAVTTLTVPERKADLPQLLSGLGLFDTLTHSSEDSARTKMLQDDRKRKAAQKEAGSFDDYLASLEIKAFIHRALPKERARVAQLTQKTNQFNLTNLRLAEGEIQTRMDSADSAVLSLTVQDRFGDLGLTGVFGARRSGDVARIELYLMSCRILGRHLEHVFLQACLEDLARAWQLREWEAEYKPTPKNRQVADFFDRAGFKPVAEDGNGGKRYRLAANQLTRGSFPVAVVTQ